jgi:hypothetical protein
MVRKEIQEVDGSVTTETAHNLNRDYMKTPDAISPAIPEALVKNYCCRNPGKAIGIALGVGIMLGAAFVKMVNR